ncbi:MAG: acyl carrier protein [Ruminococcaceae bacterium]|nr:acyl carrier protein [Oscillospiraceae bacterium]
MLDIIPECNYNSYVIDFKVQTKEDIMYDKIKDLLVEELSINPDDITPNAELVADLGINSLELADLILLCEERFDIEIGEDAAQKFLTVGDVAAYLDEIA